MKKIIYILLILFLTIHCAQRIPLGPEVSELPFPLEGDNETIDKNSNDSLTHAWQLFQKGNLEEATYVNRNALTHNIKVPALWIMEGYINLAKGNTEKAKSNFSTAHELKPDYPTALNGLALIAFLNKDYPAAYELYKKLAVAYPDFPSAKIKSDIATLKVIDYYKSKAESAVQQTKYKDAIEYYKRAIVISPTIWELHQNLGLIYLTINDYDNALVYLQLANNLNPGSKKIKTLLAELLFKTGKFNQALEYYRDLALNEPQNALWISRTRDCQRMIDFSRLPVEFKNAEKGDRITRAVFAAYLVFKIPILSRVPSKNNIILTDISNHWAKDFIITVTNLNLMEESSNHTFEPQSYVKRSDLAFSLNKLLDLAQELNPEIRLGDPELSIEINDILTEYSKYKSIRRVVSLGFMELNDKLQFKPENVISGEELTKAINKIALLFPVSNSKTTAVYPGVRYEIRNYRLSVKR
jgi:tetratricopeptide (TPR) repeat protein